MPAPCHSRILRDRRAIYALHRRDPSRSQDCSGLRSESGEAGPTRTRTRLWKSSSNPTTSTFNSSPSRMVFPDIPTGFSQVGVAKVWLASGSEERRRRRPRPGSANIWAIQLHQSLCVTVQEPDRLRIQVAYGQLYVDVDPETGRQIGGSLVWDEANLFVHLEPVVGHSLPESTPAPTKYRQPTSQLPTTGTRF